MQGLLEAAGGSAGAALAAEPSSKQSTQKGRASSRGQVLGAASKRSRARRPEAGRASGPEEVPNRQSPDPLHAEGPGGRAL